MMAAPQRTIVCWAMGLTQQKHAVPSISEITNVLLMRGMIGKPGAGLCPVRGHSNVQGDRTMGIWEKMPERFLAALDDRFGIVSPREHGFDTVDAIRAMRDGKAKVFMAMGGNFASATPDTAVTEAALRNCSLTVQVSTKLNRSHLVHGTHRADPAVAGPHRPRHPGRRQTAGLRGGFDVDGAPVPRQPASAQRRGPQRGRDRLPAGPAPCSAPTTRCHGRRSTPTTTPSATRSPPSCPAATTTTTRCAAPTASSFPIPHATPASSAPRTGKANFGVYPLEWVPVPEGRLVLQTLRSHDQYNTTIYGLDDRYRGVKGGRRVIFVNPADLDALGLSDGDRVDLISEFSGADGQLQERRAKDFAVVSYSTPVGNAAAYYPETNPLVPLDHTADRSNTPVSKAVVIRLERASQGAVRSDGGTR